MVQRQQQLLLGLGYSWDVALGDVDGDDDHADDVVSETFRLSYDAIRLHGGFDGTESAREARDPHAHVTVPSGDIDGNDTLARSLYRGFSHPSSGWCIYAGPCKCQLG